jgi:hypothetical protein
VHALSLSLSQSVSQMHKHEYFIISPLPLCVGWLKSARIETSGSTLTSILITDPLPGLFISPSHTIHEYICVHFSGGA